jgi:hypothetical protein
MPDPISLSSFESAAGQFGAPGLGIAGGIVGGGTRGDIQAATSAAKLGTNLASGGYLGQGAQSWAQSVAPELQGFSQFAQGASEVSNIYSGIKAGTPLGYTSAGVNAAELATQMGAQIPGAQYLPGIGDALSLYQFAHNWQSGATGADALAGAQTGATIGTSILPGVGTVVGAAIGAGVGALSSAFGGGRTSQEGQMSRNVNQQLANASDTQRASAMASMTPAQATQYIQGVMSAHDQSPGHAEPIQLVWGKDNSSGFIRDMTSQINSAIKSNPAIAQMSASQIYNQVVAPWLQSKGAAINPNQKGYGGSDEGKNLIDAVTNIIGQWQSGALTSSTQVGVAGQTISGLQAYAGTMSPQQLQQQQVFQNYGGNMVQQMLAQLPNLYSAPARVARH